MEIQAEYLAAAGTGLSSTHYSSCNRIGDSAEKPRRCACSDNSAANRRNPSSPPQRVTFGEQTTDEMALLFLMVAVPRLEDTSAFYRSLSISNSMACAQRRALRREP